jgi:outer membrane receptor for ferrienterochelin and colicins
MHKFILMSALLAASSLAGCPAKAAPTDANITGHVVDSETGEHMPYYTIRLLGTSIGTLTDASGHYTLRNLNPGNYTIEALCTGYKTLQKEVAIEHGRTLEINFDVTPDAFMLEQVVVTGSKSEQKRRNSPVLVSVVNNKIFDQVSACSLADGLNFQPGVRVENDCQNCGFTQVRINGLDGHYSQILMNSRPVFSALAGVYGLEQIPANMIDRVEVMRGGGSALFGSSAIGGTVNIITRDPVVNYAEVSHSLASIGISGSLDNNTTLNASVVNDNNRIGLFVYGQNRSRDGYDHNGDGFTEVAQLKTQTMGARAFLRTSDNTKLTVEYHGTHEYRRGGDRLDRPAHDAMIAEEVDHNIHGGEASFDLWSKSRADHLNIFAAAQNTKRKSYYGSEEDPNAYGRTHDLVVTSGAQWTHNFNRLWFMPAELIAGVEYNHNYLHDVTLGYDHDITQRVNIYSGYLQNEWRNDRWGFLIGARIDSHSMIDNPIISPRANIRFNPSDNINFRLSYSTGFRSPQAYDEDFHVAIVGGERVVTVLAKGLRQESSNSVSASVDLYHRFGNVQTNLMVEGFFTDLRDVFALRKLDQTDAAGNTVLERYNGSGATVGGINLEGKAVFSPRWQLQAGLTWQQSRYKRPEQWSENPEVAPVRQMFRTPDLYGYLTLNYDITRHFNASLSGTYTGSMLVQHMEGSGTDVDRAVTTPEFFDANLKVTYEFKIFHNVGLDVSASVMNIFNSYQRDFDKGHLRDSGYIYGPSLPRSLLASFKLHI